MSGKAGMRTGRGVRGSVGVGQAMNSLMGVRDFQVVQGVVGGRVAVT